MRVIWRNADPLTLAAANEGRVLVVEFFRNVLRAGLGNELHFADQVAAPGFVNARAEFAFHVFELLAPGFVVRGDLEAAFFATQRTRAGCKSLADNLGPAAFEPRKSCLGSM